MDHTNFAAVLALAALGWLARTQGWISQQQRQGAWQLVMTLFFPCLIFSLMAACSLHPKDAALAGTVFLLTLLIPWLAAPLVKSIPDPAANYLCSTAEGGTIALPLYLSLFPHGTWTLIFDIGIVTFNFAVLPLLLGTKKASLKNPFLIAMALGLLANVSGLYSHILQNNTLYQSLMDMTTAPITPIILFCLGYDLKPKEAFSKPILKLMLVRYGLMGLAALALILLFPGSGPSFVCACILYFACPPSFGMLPVLEPLYTDPEEESFTNRFVSACLAVSLAVYLILSLI